MRRVALRTAVSCAVVAIMLIGAGCDSSSRPSAESGAELASATEANPAIVAQGKALFTKHCAICHGEKGDGQGRFAYLMNPRPRNFIDAKFKLSTTVNQVPSDEDLLRTVRQGMPGSAMPPWSHLPDGELKALVAFVRNLGDEVAKAKTRQDVEDGVLTEAEGAEEITLLTVPGHPLPIPDEPPFDEERWFSGRRVYLEACAACHGQDGSPDPAAELKEDDYGFPVSPRSFVRGVFKGGSEGKQLFARILKGMRGTPMPSYEGSYTEDRVWDLVHYIQSLAQAGSQDRAWLRRGTITAKAVPDGELPTDPLAPEWEALPPTYVSLTPLWWQHDRIEGLLVQAAHDSKDLLMRITWLDTVPDDQAVKAHEFRDGVAIQFSATPDPPFYMGQPGPDGGVTLWYWKADRQKNLAVGYQDEDAAYPNRVVDMYQSQFSTLASLKKTQGIYPTPEVTQLDRKYVTGWGAGNIVSDPQAKSSVEVLEARGPGTLSIRPPIDQTVEGKGVHSNGAWYVQLRRSMTVPVATSGEQNGATPVHFKPGTRIPLSFAAWDGHTGDRDGKKQISIWQELVIE